MKVLINATSEDKLSAKDLSLTDIAQNLSRQFIQDEFILLYSPHQQDEINTSASSLKTVLIPESLVLKAFQNRKKIQEVYKQEQPQVFLTSEPILTEKIRNQFWLADDRRFLAFPKAPEKIVEKTSLKFQISQKIIFSSQEEKRSWVSIFPAYEAKTEVIYHIFPQKIELPDFENAQLIRDKYAAGIEYFLCLPEDNKEILIDVLKGFSGFKKWQKSSMRLILTGHNEASVRKIQAIMTGYRFAEEVQVISSENEDYPTILSTAYAAIVPDRYNPDFRESLQAIEMSTPLLIAEDSVQSEIIENHAFTFQAGNREDITRVMLEVFRDEQKRSYIIRSAKEFFRDHMPLGFYSKLMSLLRNPAN